MGVRVLVPSLVLIGALTASCATEAITEVQGPADSSQIDPTSTPTPVPAATGVAVASPTPVMTPVGRREAPPKRTVIRAADRGSGEAAKEFELSLLDGGTLRLSELQGKVVVLNFWASWCPPCRAEMPSFQRISEEYADRGVVFVGVAVSDTEEKARAFAERVGVTYPLGLDTTGDIAIAYRAITLPTTFLIDRRGIERRKIVNAVNEGALRIFLSGMAGGG